MKSPVPSKEQIMEKIKHLSPQDQLIALKVALEHLQEHQAKNQPQK